MKTVHITSTDEYKLPLNIYDCKIVLPCGCYIQRISNVGAGGAFDNYAFVPCTANLNDKDDKSGWFSWGNWSDNYFLSRLTCPKTVND